MGKRQVPFGIDPVQPGADHRHRGRAGVQGPGVRGPVHPQRHAGHHAHVRLAQCKGELARIGFTLRRRIAAAHDGQTAGVTQGLGLTLHVQQQGRVRHLQQVGRKAWIGQRQHVAIRRGPQPGHEAIQLGFQVFGGRLQGLREPARYDHRQCADGLLEHGLGQPKGAQQLARMLRAHAGREQQPQPCGQLVPAHARIRGW
ncbi:hypothetical protein D9M69_494280 [compost metagenome]